MANRLSNDKGKLRIQVMSDLHQERDYNDYSFSITNPNNAEYLVLAGDIGSVGIVAHRSRFRAWLLQQCRPYKRVFWVLGNNEIKRTSCANAIKIARRWAKDDAFEGKLVFLEHDRYDFDDEGYKVTLLGCVLWTTIRDGQDISDTSITQNNLAAHNQRFKNSFDWLQQEILNVRKQKGAEQRIIVVTHHTPSL